MYFKQDTRQALYHSFRITGFYIMTLPLKSVALTVVLLYLLTAQTHAASPIDDDILDFLPGIISASIGPRGPNTVSLDEALATGNIEADYDLNSATISLLPDTNLKLIKGSLTNGTLIFDGGTIDGRLLNKSLTIQGDVKLSSPVFQFDPTKWGIKQGGSVSLRQALENRQNLNKTIEFVKSLGASTMELSELDAFFDTGTNQVNRRLQNESSIRIPSDFHFKMSDETYLRVFPSGASAYSLVSLYLTDNSIVSGGHLVGERNQGFGPVGGQGFGSVIYVVGSHNALIENVDVSNTAGSGMTIHSETGRNPDGTLRPNTRTTENLLVKGGVYRDNRGSNIAVVDADGVVFDSISVFRAGQNGIELETYGADGLSANSRVKRISDIIVRNSTFKDNLGSEIDISTASNVLIEKNTFNGQIGRAGSNNVIIQDNLFETERSVSPAIVMASVESSDGEELTRNWQILRNTIRGYDIGIFLTSREITVSDNKLFENRIGFEIEGLMDSTFSNNVIESRLPDSKGYRSSPGTYVYDVFVSDERINVTDLAIDLPRLNLSNPSIDIELTFSSCTLKNNTSEASVLIVGAQGIRIENSSYSNKILVRSSNNIQLENNRLISP